MDWIAFDLSQLQPNKYFAAAKVSNYKVVYFIVDIQPYVENGSYYDISEKVPGKFGKKLPFSAQSHSPLTSIVWK
jgi:hypothetical protein